MTHEGDGGSSRERNSSKIDADRLKLAVEVWKKTVDVQQHFNDLELRIRNFALTLLVGILGGTAFAIQQGFFIPIGTFRLSLASLLLTAGLVAWFGFYILDRHWYHRLLAGSVQHGQSIEVQYSTELPELALAHAITHASHVKMDTWRLRIAYHLGAALILSAFVLGPLWLVRPDVVGGRILTLTLATTLSIVALARAVLLPDWKIRARHRIDFFYGTIAVMIIALVWAANSASRVTP